MFTRLAMDRPPSEPTARAPPAIHSVCAGLRKTTIPSAQNSAAPTSRFPELAARGSRNRQMPIRMIARIAASKSICQRSAMG